MSADKKRPSVLEQVLHPSTPAIPPRPAPAATVPDHDPQTGELNPMNRPAIRPLAGFEPSSIPHPSSPIADPPSPFTPLDPRARFGIGEPLSADPPPLPLPPAAAEIPAPTEPPLRAVTFSVTPTLGAVEHSGSILDRIR